MKIRILGTESLGVRGLSCVVEISNKKIIFDPGIALGYSRNRLLPHPVQIGVGDIIRNRIITELGDATDIVISHLHGDHIPLLDANAYQLSFDQIKKIPSNCKIWINGNTEYNDKMQKRKADIIFNLNIELNEAKGQVNEFMSFLGPVPHGEETKHNGKVIMTMITDGNQTFIHGSDIQLFSRNTIDEIIKYCPDIVLASGPPLYLSDRIKDNIENTWENSLILANNVKTLILDHHLLRCEEGLEWIEKLHELSGNRVICAADFMNLNQHLLEAWRLKLYQDIPVPKDWHHLYVENKVTYNEYMNIAREEYIWFQY